MRIVFLCGSLEPGRDGVGDYTRRLGAMLIKQGNPVVIISVRDNDVNQYTNALQSCEDIFVPVIRLPRALNSSIRITKIKECISSFAPDWVSLQYVPFAFHSKGLPLGLTKCLNKIGKGIRWHVMVHELWVGMDKEASLKFIYWGWFQKQLIKSLLTKLKPAVIHTHSNLYISMLENTGFKADHLPLFGNIPVVFNLSENDFNYPEINKTQTVAFVVFGNIHHSAPIDFFTNEARLYKMNSGIDVVLKIIGRCGVEQLNWEKTWRAGGLRIEILGEQPEAAISEVLRTASFGISTTPASLIEKSGTVAAMREHGLTVLCLSRPWHPRGFKELRLPKGIIQFKEGELKEFITSHSHKDNFTNISDITRQMTNSLQLAL